MVRDAVAAGIAPEDALVLATLNPATWHGLRHLGAIAPGYQADLLLLPDLESFVPETRAQARPAARRDRAAGGAGLGQAHRARPARGGARLHDPLGGRPGARDRRDPRPDLDRVARRGAARRGRPRGRRERDLAKIAVVERHLGTGRMAVGLVRGFGLESGALASTFAHDAHNIVVVGMDDQDMARAIARLAEIGGGVVVVEDRGVRAELALPVAGLISEAPLDRGGRGQPRAASRRRRSSAARCPRRSRRCRSSRSR